MSASDLRRRLARLEAAKAKRVRMQREHTDLEVARSVAYVLTCALEGRGCEATRETAIAIAGTLARAQRALPHYPQHETLTASASKSSPLLPTADQPDN